MHILKIDIFTQQNFLEIHQSYYIYHSLLFKLLSSIPRYRCTTVCLTFPPLEKRHLVCFCVLVIMNKTAMNIHVQAWCEAKFYFL